MTIGSESRRVNALRFWRFTRRTGIQEAVVVVIAFLVYFFIRGAVVDRAGEALSNGLDLVALERALGFYWEPAWQSWIIDEYWAVRAMNWIYFWGHMPLVVVLAIFLFVWHRSTYGLMRTAFLASGAIGVVIYALYPVAPPRLVPFSGYIDTMAVLDRVGYQAQEAQAFVNPYAAVPSLHFGWSMLLGGAFAWVGRRHVWIVVGGVMWPVLMLFSIVMTANHFIIDAVFGAIVSLAGLAVADAMRRAQPGAMRLLRTVLGRYVPALAPGD
ncbi:MAG: inositol phosphorylceramide synthase [Dehalococcoidia bacterium]|nr:inositol phosphorylceramide synthase [Dehalococcoidia bacterium]